MSSRTIRPYAPASAGSKERTVAAGYILIGALIVLLVIFALVALGLLLLDHR